VSSAVRTWNLPAGRIRPRERRDVSWSGDKQIFSGSCEVVGMVAPILDYPSWVEEPSWKRECGDNEPDGELSGDHPVRHTVREKENLWRKTVLVNEMY